MANPFFKAMGGNQAASNPMMNMAQQFRQFMQQMQGRDPNQMLSELISSGKVSQEQLNQAQQQARQMSGMFEQFKGMFR